MDERSDDQQDQRPFDFDRMGGNAESADYETDGRTEWAEWAEPAALPFTIGNAMRVGWDGFKSRYGLLLGCLVLYYLMQFGTEIVAGILSLVTILPLASWAANIFLYPLLGIGLFNVGYRVVRGRPAEVSTLFSGFTRYWPVVGASLLVFIATLILMVPAFMAMVAIGLFFFSTGGGPGSSGAGSATFFIAFAAAMVLLVVVPMLLVYPRLVYAPMIAFDTEYRTTGAADAIRIAWRMTGRPGVRSTIIGLWVTMLGILLACTILLILPVLLVALPLGIAVYGASYWQISSAYWDSQEHCCRACGYDLRDSRSDRCPECGAMTQADQDRYTGYSARNE